MQIKDAEGETAMLSRVESTFDAGQTLTVAQSWMPEEEGRFTVEAFVWENISNPDPLTDIIKTSVRVSQ